ncbi:MAG: RNA polymerase factor sigma-54 [Maledivibacter sp.]|nr:RNA polymerase factor sigma-54 [Maledivibacter sp.]
MRLSYNLNLEQTQKLVMTPELKQAIEILQYNSIELKDFIQQELVNNPVLEPSNQKSEADYESKKETKNQDEIIDMKKLFSEYDNFKSRNRIRNYEEKEETSFENYLSTETTLTEHLLFQLQFTLLKGKEKMIGRYIVENINENGYLQVNNEDICNRFSIEDSEAESIVNIIQTFDPVGVGARSLRECLIIQLRQNNVKEETIYKIIMEHLDDLGNNKINNIAKKLNISHERVQEVGDFIKTLEPKPGRIFSSSRDVRYVTPDVTVEKVNNEYIVIVRDTAAPRLTINHYYRKLLLNKEMEENTSSYINKKLNSALKLIRCIQQRRNTIYKVVKAIVDYQMDFFEKGIIYLKPLTLKEIADEVGVHESTVSRAINGKYMQCPKGIYELKYFFQSGVSSVLGEGVSAESIKSIIKDLIQNENTKKPLSDQAISDELNKTGVKISRRTVAKYRDELNIPSSSKRRRY